MQRLLCHFLSLQEMALLYDVTQPSVSATIHHRQPEYRSGIPRQNKKSKSSLADTRTSVVSLPVGTVVFHVDKDEPVGQFAATASDLKEIREKGYIWPVPGVQRPSPYYYLRR